MYFTILYRLKLPAPPPAALCYINLLEYEYTMICTRPDIHERQPVFLTFCSGGKAIAEISSVSQIQNALQKGLKCRVLSCCIAAANRLRNQGKTSTDTDVLQKALLRRHEQHVIRRALLQHSTFEIARRGKLHVSSQRTD